ncbi:MAG: capsule biosynthesis protein CapK, partial [Planctomycetales bacterium 12-60-4]
MYGTLYRYVLLPFFDGVVKGRKTLRHWRTAEDSQWWGRAQLESMQLAALRQLLMHAEQTCPYYAEIWRDRGLSAASLESLTDLQRWPVITRETIRQQRLRMRTTAPVVRMTKATGGSSGEPLQFDLDSGSNDRRTALMYRGYGWAGGAPGSKQLYVWGSHVGNVPTWKRWKADLHHRLDRHLVLSCFEFTADKMRTHLARWNRYRPEVVVGYTNPLYEFARFCEQSGLTPTSPRSIIVGAEKLHEFQRETLTRVFRAPVFETYGS